MDLYAKQRNDTNIFNKSDIVDIIFCALLPDPCPLDPINNHFYHHHVKQVIDLLTFGQVCRTFRHVQMRRRNAAIALIPPGQFCFLRIPITTVYSRICFNEFYSIQLFDGVRILLDDIRGYVLLHSQDYKNCNAIALGKNEVLRHDNVFCIANNILKSAIIGPSILHDPLEFEVEKHWSLSQLTQLIDKQKKKASEYIQNTYDKMEQMDWDSLGIILCSKNSAFFSQHWVTELQRKIEELGELNSVFCLTFNFESNDFSLWKFE